MMSLDLSENYAKELKRYRFIMDDKLSPEDACRLAGSYDSVRFPDILSEADVAHIIGAGEPGQPVIQPCPLDYTPPPSNPTSSSAQQHSDLHLFHDWVGYLRDTILGDNRASNNWVVSGRLTSSGKPFLANDPHLQLMAPSVWTLVHLHSTDTAYDAVGAAFPGLPGVVLGRNRRIAWGVTNSGADVQDLMMLQESADGLHYRYKGTWRAYDIDEAVIRVKHGEDQVLVIKTCIWGPVLNGQRDHPPMALRWNSLDREDHTLTSFLAINRASNWDEFTDAVRSFRAPLSNMVYADVDGNIGYRLVGQVPLREATHSGAYPVVGDGSVAWKNWNDTDGTYDVIPFMKMPSVLNPAKGFIATANNRLTPRNWPAAYRIAAEWDSGPSGYRAKRISELLAASNNHTMASMQNVQLDTTSLVARDFLPLIAALPNEQLSSEAQFWKLQLTARSKASDLFLDTHRGSEATTVFEKFYGKLSAYPTEVYKLQNTPYVENPVYLWTVFVNQSTIATLAFAVRAFNEASHDTTQQWGFGNCHQARFKHQVLGASPLACIANRWSPHGGDAHTVNVGHFNFTDEKKTMVAGPSYRQIVDLASIESSLFLNPLGQSGNILSKQYDNMLRQWTAGQYLPMRMDHYEVATQQVLLQ